MRALVIGALVALLPQVATASQTTYTLPRNVHWIEDRSNGVQPGSYYAVLRGKEADKCDNIFRIKFPGGFIYPWHTNKNAYAIYTVLEGTLVIGFDRNHAKSAERVLPAGSVIQGLGSEPHYGRAIGETIFDVYFPCSH